MRSAAAAPEIDFAPGLERAFAQPPAERDEILGARDVEGRLPDWLRGAFYLNGPARFERGGLRYRHWLDGDGMLLALRFAPQGLRFRSRFVRGLKWRDEEAAGRALYRAFGTAFPGDRLVHGVTLASPLNVSVVPFASRLLAFGEQGLPWEVDPETLETRGEFTFGGALNAISPLAAHPKLDPRSGELWSFGVSFAAARPCLHLYRFAPDGRLLRRRRVPLGLPVSLHDFALAPRHAVFHVAPYVLDMQALQDGAALIDALRWEPRHESRLLVVAREGDAPALEVPLGAGYSLHTLGAFEDQRQGTLTLDCLELERPVYDQYQPLPDLFREVSPGRPTRLVVDLRAGALLERRTLPYELAPDFGAVDPRRFGLPGDDVWVLGVSTAGRPGRKFFDQLAHLRWSRPTQLDLWQAPAEQYLAGEPAFAADPRDEEGGALLCPLWDARRDESALLVFDAREVAAGPRARLRLPERMHLGFHTTFAAAQNAPR